MGQQNTTWSPCVVCPCNKSLKLLYSQFGLLLLSELPAGNKKFSKHSQGFFSDDSSLFLKAISCHPVGFLLLCLPSGFCCSCQNNSPLKSLPCCKIPSDVSWTQLILLLLTKHYAKLIAIYIAFSPGIWSHLSSKINHPDDVTTAAGEIPLCSTWYYRSETSSVWSHLLSLGLWATVSCS